MDIFLEMNLSLQKELTVFIANPKKSFQGEKLNCIKLESSTMKLTVSQYFKTSLMKLVEILTNSIFLLLYNEMCQHLEDLLNFSEQIFSK